MTGLSSQAEDIAKRYFLQSNNEFENLICSMEDQLRVAAIKLLMVLHGRDKVEKKILEFKSVGLRTCTLRLLDDRRLAS